MSIKPIPPPRNPALEQFCGEASRASYEMPVDDESLARSISRDSTAALEELIGRYWAPLATYASRIVDDQELAEDIVLKVFAEVWGDRSSWSPRSVRAYLFRCTRNLALDELRSRTARHRRERLIYGGQFAPPPEPDEVLEESTLAGLVDAAIQELPQRRREAFVLTYLKQLSYSETAEVMGVSTKTVGHHVSAALTDLRKALAALVESDETSNSVRPLRPLRGGQSEDQP